MTEKSNARKRTSKPQQGIIPKEEEKPLFSKKQLSESGRFSAERDILAALLKDDELYTAEQAKKIIDEYMKGRVK